MNEKTYITLPSAKGVYLITVKDIIAIKSNDKICTFYLKEKKAFEVRFPIGKVEEMLGNASFIRCHQSWIVNILEIEQIYSGSAGILLSNGLEILISKRCRLQFRENIMELCHLVANGI
jgi:two-component system LytT family response regulator